jgi:single-strand DNA-binding protein
MAAQNINRVILTGRLTRDPELRTLPSGMSVCSLRVAFNTRKKDQATGEWGEKGNFVDVTVFGRQGEIVQQYMSKGRAIAIDGRLEWREWQDKDGNNRQSIEIVADNTEFIGGRDEGMASGGGGGFAPRSDVPVDASDFAAQPVANGAPAQPASAPAPAPAPADDDIPF